MEHLHFSHYFFFIIIAPITCTYEEIIPKYGYLGYVFTGNLDLAKKIGFKTKRRIEFFTSPIDCRLFEYELYRGTRRTIEANEQCLKKEKGLISHADQLTPLLF